jgi:tripartite-type tricarboxylate transporter receptor subunit TctC
MNYGRFVSLGGEALPAKAGDGSGVSARSAVFAPAGTPKDIVDRMGAVLTEALANPKVVETLAKAALSPVGGTPEATARRFEAEGETWLNAVRTLGLKPS